MAWKRNGEIQAMSDAVRDTAVAESARVEAVSLTPDASTSHGADFDAAGGAKPAPKSAGGSGPGVPHEISQDAAPAPSNVPRASIKRRIGSVSGRLSHAACLGLIAVGLLPVARPSADVKPATVVLQPDMKRAAIVQKDDATSSPNAETIATGITDRMVATQSVPAVDVPTDGGAPAKRLKTAEPVLAGRSEEASAPPRRVAMVAPVRREPPRPVEIAVTPDTPRVAEAKLDAAAQSASGTKLQLKLPKGKMKVVRARTGAPVVTLKAATPPRQSVVVASVTLASIAAVEPETLGPVTTQPPKLTVKTVSERKAKPMAEAQKPRRVVTVEPIPQSQPLPPAGVATRPEKTTVVEAWSADQIADGRKVCEALLQGSDVVANDAPPLKEGACGAPAPVVVRRLGAPKVDVQPAAMMTCPMAASLNTWITKAVQPAALENFGVPVVRLLSASSYSCRNRYGQANTQLSEHALVNALDLSGFVLADGRTIRVIESWGPVARDTKPEPVKMADANASRPGMMKLGTEGGATSAGKSDATSAKPHLNPAAGTSPKDTDAAKRSAFLRKVHQEACGTFGTVLGPEANDAHRNHFHLDMMARRHTSFCQ